MVNKQENQKRSTVTYLREIEIKYKKSKISEGMNPQITNPEIIVELFRDLQNETKEKMICVSLNVKNKIICFEVVAIGCLNQMEVRPVEMLRTPVLVNARGIILIHNHPSGDPSPSDEDEKITKAVITSASTLGIDVLDHIIIGEDNYYSFNRDGSLNENKYLIREKLNSIYQAD